MILYIYNIDYKTIPPPPPKKKNYLYDSISLYIRVEINIIQYVTNFQV